LVREDDRLEAGHLAPDLLQPLGGFARTEPSVDEDAGTVALEVVRVARAARPERSDDHGFHGSAVSWLRGLEGLLGCWVTWLLRLFRCRHPRNRVTVAPKP